MTLLSGNLFNGAKDKRGKGNRGKVNVGNNNARAGLWLRI